MTKIDKKIIGYSVVKKEEAKKDIPVVVPEKVKRPEVLTGCTYKIAATPLSEHALYVTINDRVVDGQRIPFEIFLNCREMKNFQWIVALTRVMSAVFRKGGEINFLIEELKSVFTPEGGAFIGGRYVPSLVSQIGDVIERHLIDIGLHTKDNSLQEATVAMVNEKLSKYNKSNEKSDDGFPDNATLCSKCNHRSVVVLDNCSTCLNCSDSKCS